MDRMEAPLRGVDEETKKLQTSSAVAESPPLARVLPSNRPIEHVNSNPMSHAYEPPL